MTHGWSLDSKDRRLCAIAPAGNADSPAIHGNRRAARANCALGAKSP